MTTLLGRFTLKDTNILYTYEHKLKSPKYKSKLKQLNIVYWVSGITKPGKDISDDFVAQ